MDRLVELEVFVEVVERGDFSAAARALGLTPSAVSKTIKRLERRLGARLLERTSRIMRPTREGDRLHTLAVSAIQAVDQAEAEVSGALKSPDGDLRVHAAPTFAIYQIARIVPEFRRRYPDIRLSFMLNNEPLDMAENRIDLSLWVGQPPPSDLIRRKVARSRWITCASPDYIARRGAPRALSDLAGHECLGLALDEARRSAQPPSSEAAGIRLLGSPVAANNGIMLQALARVGVGVVRLAEYHVSADIEAGRLVALLQDEPDEWEDVYALYPGKLRSSTRVRAFIDFLQEAFSSPTWNSTQGVYAPEAAA